MPLKSYKMPFLAWSLLAGSVLLSPGYASSLRPAVAGTDVVTSAADDGSPGTLRSVLAAAAAGDTVTFAPAVFAVPQTISLSSGELDISRNISIQGPGANRLTIDAHGASYVFNVTAGTVALSSMTVTHGAGANRYGSIVNASTLTLTNVVVSGSTGSGVANTGSLSATGCAFSGNNNVGGNYTGGGLYNSGTASLTSCTFAGNTAYFGGAALSGGNRTNTITLTNCTFTNNTAQFGGAVYDMGTVTAKSCTFSGNAATQDRGNYGGSLFNIGTGTVTSCLFVGSTGGDIDNGGSLTSGGSNLLGDASANGDFTTAGTHDQFGVSTSQAAIGPLASNGGPTQTCALLTGSPALDADYTSGSTADQRGIPRPQGVRSDIGAYEAGPIAYTLWNSADGQVQVRAVNSGGSQTTLSTFGPYTDSTDTGVPGNTALWKAIAVARVPDGTLRLLWQHPDGRVMLWRLNASGTMLSIAGFGPYTDSTNIGVPGNTGLWHVIGLSVSAEGQTHLLWDHPDGRAMLWNVNTDDSFAVIAGYGPYTDSTDTGVPGNTAVWHATALANAPDGSFRLLWNHPDGRVMLWNVNGAGVLVSLGGYGPYTDSTDSGVANNTALFKAVAVQVSADSQSHLLWSNPDGRSMVWGVDGSYNIATLTGYGPYTDAPISSGMWQSVGLALTPANLPYVLWNNPDNRTVLWNLSADGTVNYSGVFEAATDSAGQFWQSTTVSGL